MKKKASKELMKDINFRVILRKIFENGEISRASLAKTTGLSAATVSKIVSEQMDAGIVSEVGSEISTGGRKPILLSINPSFKIVYGVKIGLGYINLVITDLNGKLLLSGIEQTEPQIRPEKVVELVAGSLDRMRRSLAMPADRLLGIGLAVSGVVDPVAGIVRNSFLLEWEDVPIRQLIEQRVGAKTYVMNDVDSFSLAQMWKGKARNYRNAVFITLGSGVGGAIFLEGNLYSSRGGTGEIGHMTVVKDGRKCTCGSRGCLEAEASFEALANDIWKFSKTREVQRLYEEMKRTESSELEFIREALRIEGSMDEAFRNYSEIIGIALKNVVNIFAPEYILIGGEALEFKDHYLKESIEICKVNSFGRIVQGVTFDIDEMGELAWVLGAVYRVIEDTLFTVSTSLTGEVLE